jgi:hypothetical protein
MHYYPTLHSLATSYLRLLIFRFQFATLRSLRFPISVFDLYRH